MRALGIVLALFSVCLTARAQSSLPKATAWQVNLVWQAPASSQDPVAGYDAYRAPSGSTNFAQLNTGKIVATAFSDLTATGDQTYDYEVKSVDAQGNTSAPSNIAEVSVPASLLAATISGKTT